MPTARAARTAWAPFLSMALSAASAVAIGFTNADRFIDPIHERIPLTKPTTCGPTWSVTMFLLLIGSAAIAFLLARAARTSPLLARTASVAAIATGSYWAVVGFFDTLATGCIA